MFQKPSAETLVKPIMLGDESPTLRKSVYKDSVVFKPSFISLEEKHGGSTKERQSKCGLSTREKLLLFTVAVLLVLALVFVVLYATRSRHSTDEKVDICSTPECTLASSGLLSGMNTSVDPCKDFYQYACGQWLEDNPIPESKSSWSQFRVLYQRNEVVMRQLLTSPATIKDYAENKAVMKALHYYDSCHNEKQIEDLGAGPLESLIKLYGSWNVTNSTWDEKSWDFMDVFVKIQKNLSIAPFYNMYVSTDLKNSTQNVMVLDQSGTGISQEAFFFNTTHHRKVRAAYKEFMISLAKELGAGDQAEPLMMEVYKLEETLAKNFIPRAQRRDTNKMYKKMRLGDLVKRVGKELRLMEFLRKMFVQTGYKITEDEQVVVYAADYLKNVSTILNSTSDRVKANYMMWRVVSRLASSLSGRFREAYLVYRERVYGSRGEEPRWQVCIGDVDAAFGMALGVMFVDKKFKGSSKEMADKMIRDIRQVFLSNLEKQTWMDESTKKAAREKALAINENIGYPAYIVNETLLAKSYEGLLVSKESYFDNVVLGHTFFNLKNYERLGKPVDKKRWSMTPPTVNAYYSSTTNKIAFPAGILQKPFYDKSFPKSLNYGGIGMVVGHEITHGFDDNGRLFNKDGNLKKWWSNSSAEAFKARTQCLIDQYSNFTLFGKNLNGEQTLGENIADNGGLKQAFYAYQGWKKRHGDEPRLPGLDLSNEQLFFLGFAQIWCSAFREESASRQIEYGVHSPGQFRVIGTLANFDEFAKAYNCPSGSPMNPKKKCSVW